MSLSELTFYIKLVCDGLLSLVLTRTQWLCNMVSGWNLMRRIRHVIAVGHYAGMGLYGGPVGGTALYFWLLYKEYYLTIVIYTLWYIYDWKTPETGGRQNHVFRNTFVWRWIVEYLPLRLVKTADLPDNRNYILATHPHGLLGYGILPVFATDAAGFTTLFPGIRPVLASLKALFFFPIFREYLILSNTVSVCSRSLQYILTRRGTGNAVCVVVGGTRELLEAYPGSTKTVLKNRKGFVKIALKTGADLVPVYVFGENDLYRQIHHVRPFQWFKTVQMKFMTTFGFVWVAPTWPLPKRRPLYTVVGSPISVTRNDDPNQEEIDTLHNHYVTSLTNLFEEHKLKYGYKSTQKLEFI